MPESFEDCQQIHQEQPKTTNQSMIDYQEMQQDYRRSIYMNREQKKKNPKMENRTSYGKM